MFWDAANICDCCKTSLWRTILLPTIATRPSNLTWEKEIHKKETTKRVRIKEAIALIISYDVEYYIYPKDHQPPHFWQHPAIFLLDEIQC